MVDVERATQEVNAFGDISMFNVWCHVISHLGYMARSFSVVYTVAYMYVTFMLVSNEMI